MPTDYNVVSLVVEFLQPANNRLPCELALLIWAQQLTEPALSSDYVSKVDEQPTAIVFEFILGKRKLALQRAREPFPCFAYPPKRHASLSQGSHDGNLDQLHIGQRLARIAWRQRTGGFFLPLADGLWSDSRVSSGFLDLVSRYE